jgi:hypothetical protein
MPVSAAVCDLAVRRRSRDPRSVEIVEIAMAELGNAANAAELLRAVARITGIGECRLRRSWCGAEGLRRAAIRRALTLAFG